MILRSTSILSLHTNMKLSNEVMVRLNISPSKSRKGFLDAFIASYDYDDCCDGDEDDLDLLKRPRPFHLATWDPDSKDMEYYVNELFISEDLKKVLLSFPKGEIC